MDTLCQIYLEEIDPCPRSPEWKSGALDGLRKAAGLRSEGCPAASGTAQADAWKAGFDYASTEFRDRVIRPKGRA